jgi:hypothetical protein
LPFRLVTRSVALCPAQHRGVIGDPCENFAAQPAWCAFPGWPLPPDGVFRAELVVVGQGPFDTPSGWKRQSVDAGCTEDERIKRATELSHIAHVGARFHRLHIIPLMREIFCTGGGSPPPYRAELAGAPPPTGSEELPWSRIFFTEAVFCPRRTGSPLALETVAQCASLHLREILSQPSIKVILCLGDDAVQAVTGRYRWEPWKALHGRVQQREAAPSLVFAVHPMAAREGGGQPWSRQVRGKLAEVIRGELNREMP